MKNSDCCTAVAEEDEEEEGKGTDSKGSEVGE
jgi:hypothetical protein